MSDGAIEFEDLKVRTNLIPVEVSLGGAAARRIDIYVAEYKPHSWRRQDVFDLLEDETGFLPAKEPGGGWLLLNKGVIAWLALDRAAESGEQGAPEELFDVKHDVSLDLMSGAQLEGQLLYTAPPARARVKDYLNEPGMFFRLYRQDRVYVINKRFLACVRERGDGAGGSGAARN